MAIIEEQEKRGLFSIFGRRHGSTSRMGRGDSKGKGQQQNADTNTQGFLVPKNYRTLSKYRNGSLFRLTSILLLTTFIVGGVQLYKWRVAGNNKVIAEQAQNLETEESARLQEQATGLRPVRFKFAELEVLRRQLRIPLAPLLDTIEKTIPDNISVNKINWLCPPVMSTGTLKRRANVQIEVYFPNNVDANDSKLMLWPEKMKEAIANYGLQISQSDWGPEKRFEPTNEQRVKAKTQFGTTRTLSLTVELAGD